MGPELQSQPRLGHSCLPRHPSPPPHTHTHLPRTLTTHSGDPLTKRCSAPKETHQKFSLIDLETERGFLPPLVSFFNMFVSRGSRPHRRSRHGGANCWDQGFFLSKIHFASFFFFLGTVTES